jgi:hypothetical protein
MLKGTPDLGGLETRKPNKPQHRATSSSGTVQAL